MPAAWEYARLSYSFGRPAKDKPEQGHVAFTHHGEGWEIPEGEVWETLRRLGDEGWELVTKPITHRMSAARAATRCTSNDR